MKGPTWRLTQGSMAVALAGALLLDANHARKAEVTTDMNSYTSTVQIGSVRVSPRPGHHIESRVNNSSNSHSNRVDYLLVRSTRSLLCREAETGCLIALEYQPRDREVESRTVRGIVDPDAISPPARHRGLSSDWNAKPSELLSFYAIDISSRFIITATNNLIAFRPFGRGVICVAYDRIADVELRYVIQTPSPGDCEETLVGLSTDIRSATSIIRA